MFYTEKWRKEVKPINEWTIVTVLLTLISLGTAVMAPILRLSSTISKLSVLIDGALKYMARLRSHIDENDEKLQRLNHRITVLEAKGNLKGEGR